MVYEKKNTSTPLFRYTELQDKNKQLNILLNRIMDDTSDDEAKDKAMEQSLKLLDDMNMDYSYLYSMLDQIKENYRFDPNEKTLRNFTLVTNTKKKERFITFKRDKNNNIIDNMLIKSDNYAAMHALKEIFKGKVKLIYIDPPHNTGSKDLNYKDNYHHEEWLNLMKSRLIFAKRFLRDDGMIFVSCDDNEQAYLKVLMDEIFGRSNALVTTIWSKCNTQNDADDIQNNHEYILAYYNKEKTKLRVKQTGTKNILRDKEGYFYLGDDLVSGYPSINLRTLSTSGCSIYYNEDTKDFVACDDYDKKAFLISDDEKEVYADSANLISKGYTKIIRPPKIDNKLGSWSWPKERFNRNKGLVHISDGYKIRRKVYVEDVSNIKDNKVKVISSSSPKSIVEIYSGLGDMHLNDMFGYKIFENPKPEELIHYIMEMTTNKGDIVLDFFAGSGTTAAVAHKTGRQWIAIEKEEDIIFKVTKKRLEKVLKGELGGISKAVNWQGGGSFVYMDMKIDKNKAWAIYYNRR